VVGYDAAYARDSCNCGVRPLCSHGMVIAMRYRTCWNCAGWFQSLKDVVICSNRAADSAELARMNASGVARGGGLGGGGFKPPPLRKVCVFYCLVIEQKQWLIIKIVTTRCRILRLNAPNFDFGSRSRWGSSQHSPRPLAAFKGSYF